MSFLMVSVSTVSVPVWVKGENNKVIRLPYLLDIQIPEQNNADPDQTASQSDQDLDCL